MAKRTKDEAEQTRNAIIDAAENVFYDRGVSRTSLEQVAAAAGVTRGAVYWHFKDKIELCVAMSDRVFLPHEDMLRELAERSSATPLQDLKKSCLQSLRLMATDKQRQKVVSILTLRCEYVEEMNSIMDRRHQCKKRMLAISKKIFIRAAKLKMLDPIWTPAKAALALQALIVGLITLALEQKRDDYLVGSGAACVNALFASFQKKA